MTQQEFETRYGKKVTAEQFESINASYMATSFDKDAFVKALKCMNPDAMQIMYENGQKLRNSEVIVSELQRVQREGRKEMGYFLADEAHEFSSGKARAKAIEILGFKAYIKYVIEKGWNLWELDKEALLEIL